MLQAVALFLSGSQISRTHYFDASIGIRIGLTFEDISDSDIERLAEEHRERIRAIITDGRLALVRVYGIDGKGSLKYRKLHPKDTRFSDEAISELIKGLKGKTLADAVINQFPELSQSVASSMTQAEVKTLIQQLANSLPEADKHIVDADLPTGIDKSLAGFLPESIYIPAVKDFKDDIKTSESTPFGKILGILLKVIEPALAEEGELFEKLNAKLNPVRNADGSIQDNRLSPIKLIERTVEKYTQDSFRNVKLRIEIPPPELKTVLSSASIYVDDGVEGTIDTKGDGLRRAIIFAILRSFVELSKKGLLDATDTESGSGPAYLLLFEEPELYLHPNAQQVLFDALSLFANRHPVMLTTHSPTFFGPRGTTTFVKMRKRLPDAPTAKPFGIAHPVDLKDTNTRDQFQIICYENNNIAFFADTVVLVEGDSDFIVFPHLARLINPLWDIGHQPVRFARISGKANIRRYRQFFGKFETRVVVVTDLDFLLGNEFAQIDPTADISKLRSELFVAVDAVILSQGGVPEPTQKHVKEAHARGDLRAKWTHVRKMKAEYDNGTVSLGDLNCAIEEFFAWEKYWARRDMLMDCPTPEIFAKKRELLTALRLSDVCVLEKGAIESYYPEGITGESKPAKAQCLCDTVTTKDTALGMCNHGHDISDGCTGSEFEAIFHRIFACA